MLEGRIRESISKANAKALRDDGYLIANIYAKGVENIHCAFKINDFIRTIKAKTSLVFPVKVGDKTLDVIIQEYQKDPVYGTILHVDFMIAQKGIITHYKIPIKTQGTAVGLKNKGVILVAKKRISVKAAPEYLPASYTLDISALDVGHSILVRDLPALEGITIRENPSVAIVSCIKAK